MGPQHLPQVPHVSPRIVSSKNTPFKIVWFPIWKNNLPASVQCGANWFVFFCSSIPFLVSTAFFPHLSWLPRLTLRPKIAPNPDSWAPGHSHCLDSFFSSLGATIGRALAPTEGCDGEAPLYPECLLFVGRSLKPGRLYWETAPAPYQALCAGLGMAVKST